MALTKCKECGKEISKDATSCPNCGAPVKKKRPSFKKIITALVIVFVVYAVYLFNTEQVKSSFTPAAKTTTQNTSNSKSKETPKKEEIIELTQGQRDAISNLTAKGVLSIEPFLNKAMIDPNIWGQLKYDLKENVAKSLAIHCGNKKGNHIYWVDIYDMYSGKKLAKYSNSWGFKVY